MHALEALCGNCEHSWDVREHGVDECPFCGSNKVIKPTALRGEAAQGGIPTMVIRLESATADQVGAGQAGIAVRRTAVDASALKGALWVLLCAVGATSALASGLSLAALPFKVLLMVFAVLTLSKLILVGLLAGSIAKELAERHIPLEPGQVVGHVIFEALIIAGLAGLLSIWWPLAGTFVMLAGSVYCAIAVVAMLAGVVLRIASNVISVALYAALAGAAGYHGLQWLLGA